MASRFLHSLSDENADIQRQISCMTGIFQLFDRHHALTGRRHISPNKPQQQYGSTSSHINHDGIEGKEKISNNYGNEKQRAVVSMESSQASFSSSSRSSSFSSIDCSRTGQTETGFSFERVIFPDTPQFPNNHSDLRDVELSDWSLNQTASSKSPWSFDENGGVNRIFAFPKEFPRASHDLGENFKATAPRLSLDSREVSLRSFKDSKPSLLRNSKSQREGSGYSTDLVSSLQQTSSSTVHNRLPGVVAKLMGLEALPPPPPASLPSSSMKTEDPKPSKPRQRNNEVVVMKPITTSRFPIEPAPWKQQIDHSRRRSKIPTKSSHLHPSFYSEIQNRTKLLEFKQPSSESNPKPSPKSKRSESPIVKSSTKPKSNLRTPKPPPSSSPRRSSSTSPKTSPPSSITPKPQPKKPRPPSPPDPNKPRKQRNNNNILLQHPQTPIEKLDLEQQQLSPVSVLDNPTARKLENIELLLEKINRLNSTSTPDNPKTDYIASLCENANPDHRYISEILLASGLILKDHTKEPFCFHPSGHPINPKLYSVLEQTNKEDNNNKVHRKLVFDAVNEILSVKLSSKKPCMNGQRLLKELCLEIDQKREQKKRIEDEKNSLKSLVWEDVINERGQWKEFSKEVPEAVLDVERMVFKDLVDEILRGEDVVFARRFRLNK